MPSKYKPEYSEMLVEHMREGYSFATFAARVGTTRRTLYTWVGDHEDFAQAKEIGHEAALMHFETCLVDKTVGRSRGDTNAIMFALRTRFYKDYQETRKEEVEITSFNFSGDNDG